MSTRPDRMPNPSAGPASARLEDVTYRYRRGTTALQNLTLALRPGVITGLLGRNGSGKTTLAMLLAGQNRATSGRVLVDEASVWEDTERMAAVALVSSETRVFADYRLRDTLELWAETRPTWDQGLADRLLEQWKLDPAKDRPESLSRGQLSAFSAVLGLASRAPLTIFDEVHLGMDAVVRRQFTTELLADYAEHPRTIVLSSHLIEEVSDLLEDVILLHEGRLLDAGEADAVRARHADPATPERLPDLTDVLIRLTETEPTGQSAPHVPTTPKEQS